MKAVDTEVLTNLPFNGFELKHRERDLEVHNVFGQPHRLSRLPPKTALYA